ncbi:MAG: recombination regulator RecX [Spirochaetes bacterium]|nr:recombination regulator RecX [Spirochaetota bacterium]
MGIISDIVPQKRNKNYFSVYIDNKYSFSLSSSDLNFLKLKVNDTLTEERVNDLIRIYSLQKAKDYAYKILSRKAYSEKAMFEKLVTKYNEKIAAEVLKGLKELDYINDEKLIYEYAKGKIEFRPMGRWKLKQDLTQKKFDADMIRSAIDKIFNEVDEFELAMKVFNKKFGNIKKVDSKMLMKIKNHLLSNGFDSQIVIKIIQELRY